MRGRPRTPLAKAEATGAVANNPKRYRDRKEPPSKPIGEPSPGLTKAEIKYWHAFTNEATWLVECDRSLLEVACKLRAKLFTRDGLDGSERSNLVSILSKLGMTPVDRSRVLVTDAPSSQTAEEKYLN